MDIDQTSWAVMREISRMAYNVDADQITRAVNQLKAQTLFSQDGPSGEPNSQSLSSIKSSPEGYPLLCLLHTVSC